MFSISNTFSILELITQNEEMRVALQFYGNQLLDYNEVVSTELLADKGRRARDIINKLTLPKGQS